MWWLGSVGVGVCAAMEAWRNEVSLGRHGVYTYPFLSGAVRPVSLELTCLFRPPMCHSKRK